MKKAIASTQAPAAIGPYSQAINIRNALFISGQLGINPDTGDIVTGGVREQTIQICKNIDAILTEANSSVGDVVKTTVFLSDMADFTQMNEVYASYFKEPYPARSTVAVNRLPKNALVEIEVIAIRNVFEKTEA